MSINLPMAMKRGMPIHSIAVFVFWFVLSCSVPVMAEDDAPSLCKPGEGDYFSCLLTNEKIVSLCGAKSPTNGEEYLQYRFGKSLSLLELEYPSREARPVSAFKFYTEGGAKTSMIAISFSVSKHRYSLFSTSSVYGFNGAGLIANKLGRRISKMDCKKPLSFERRSALFSLKKFGMLGSAEDVDYVGPEQ